MSTNSTIRLPSIDPKANLTFRHARSIRVRLVPPRSRTGTVALFQKEYLTWQVRVISILPARSSDLTCRKCRIEIRQKQIKHFNHSCTLLLIQWSRVAQIPVRRVRLPLGRVAFWFPRGRTPNWNSDLNWWWRRRCLD
jgi:hypothetical protein